MDPVTNLISVGTVSEVKSLLPRLIDFFKMRQITAFFTSLNSGNQVEESTDIGIELIDVYIGQGDVLNGTARMAQEIREHEEILVHLEELARQRREQLRKENLLRAQIAALQHELDSAPMAAASSLACATACAGPFRA